MFRRKEDEEDSLSYLDELIEKSKDYEIPEEIEEFAENIGGGWWNYRFLEIIQGSTKFYELHEVYYDGEGKPWAWSDVVKLWFTDKYDYKHMIKSLKHAYKKTILRVVKDGEDEKLVDTNMTLKQIKEEQYIDEEESNNE